VKSKHYGFGYFVFSLLALCHSDAGGIPRFE
jgi:hypothetical protein